MSVPQGESLINERACSKLDLHLLRAFAYLKYLFHFVYPSFLGYHSTRAIKGSWLGVGEVFVRACVGRSLIYSIVRTSSPLSIGSTIVPIVDMC